MRGDTIEAVGRGLTEQVGDDAIVIDAGGTIIVPGLIDSHLHAWEGQVRGIAPDADFGEYMAITHNGLALHYRPEDLAIAERLSAAQAINAGTTTFIDNSHNSRSREHSDAAIEALLGTGIRAVYAAGDAQAGDRRRRLPRGSPAAARRVLLGRAGSRHAPHVRCHAVGQNAGRSPTSTAST